MQGLPEEVAAAFLKQNELDEHVCRLASSHPEPTPDPDPDPDPDPEPNPDLKPEPNLNPDPDPNPNPNANQVLEHLLKRGEG